jgi:hypothetical protein
MTILEHNKKDLKVIQTPWGEEYACAYCGGSVDWVDCENCDDGYTDHDCGEDCCCCLDPEPNVICDICDGKGGWYKCLSNCGKKAPTPIEIAAAHPAQTQLLCVDSIKEGSK